MNIENPEKWTLEHSAETYAIKQWGDGYFAINEDGHVCVKPVLNSEFEVDLYEIAQSLKDQGLSFPVLVRFIDILCDRVQALQCAFDTACKKNNYTGSYTPVYPIKVNQQRKVIEGIQAAGNVGLEAGSKPELLAILALSEHGLVICNGYKDRAYIRLALIGLQMGQDVTIVIEKLSELELIIEQAASLNIKPQLGIRIRLSSISTGKWQNSGGENSKFGLHASDILRLVKRLDQANMLDTLKLMHFHIGSQVANIHDIKTALAEAGRNYAELHKLGAAIKIVDTGGGLGINYDGSGSRRDFSVNYSIEEYAQNIIRCFSETCAENNLPQPDILTESGRAIAAHHALLITNVIDSETVHEQTEDITKPSGQGNIVESYHDAQFDLADARGQFLQGKLSLSKLAEAEQHHLSVCQSIKARLDPRQHEHQEIIQELDEKLADKLFCNFSIFQSLPDIWGIEQIFPIMPIHRLDEQPSRRGIIQDLTCDSDGRIDLYIDSQNIEKTLPVHAINLNEPYLLGFF